MAPVEHVNGAHTNIPPEQSPPHSAISVLTPLRRREATERIIATVSKCTNPETGQLYTYDELARKFSMSKSALGKKLKKQGVLRQPMPETQSDELPDNEFSFFQGLAFSDCTSQHIRWGKKTFVFVRTNSSKKSRHDLLKNTIGTWGEIRDTFDGTKVYLDSPKFDFMLNPKVDDRFLRARSRFAPFLLGMLTGRLSSSQNRLSLRDRVLLRMVHQRFLRYFGFSMGNFATEQKNNKHRSRNGIVRVHDLSVIKIKSPEQVFAALLSEKAVASLPFLADIARLSPE